MFTTGGWGVSLALSDGNTLFELGASIASRHVARVQLGAKRRLQALKSPKPELSQHMTFTDEASAQITVGIDQWVNHRNHYHARQVSET